MKKNLFYSLLLLLLFTSCGAPYQVFDTASSNVERYENDVFAFENENLAISYDFWANRGIVLFNITNKTDSLIFIDFGQSTFSVNDETIAYAPDVPIFGDRRFIKAIEPHKSLNIEGFPVANRWLRGVAKNEVKSYNESDSPFQFQNKLVYDFDEEFENSKSISNEFWVTSVQRLRHRDFKDVNKYDTERAGKFYLARGDTFDGDPTLMWVQVGINLLEILFLL